LQFDCHKKLPGAPSSSKPLTTTLLVQHSLPQPPAAEANLTYPSHQAAAHLDINSFPAASPCCQTSWETPLPSQSQQQQQQAVQQLLQLQGSCKLACLLLLLLVL
jgi:hypothetical protein